MMNSRSQKILFVLLSIALVALAIGDLAIGTTDIALSDVWAALVGGATTDEYRTIVCELRLPKVIVAIAAGMALAASGLEMQTLFRNPLLARMSLVLTLAQASVWLSSRLLHLLSALCLARYLCALALRVWRG